MAIPLTLYIKDLHIKSSGNKVDAGELHVELVYGAREYRHIKLSRDKTNGEGAAIHVWRATSQDIVIPVREGAKDDLLTLHIAVGLIHKVASLDLNLQPWKDSTTRSATRIEMRDTGVLVAFDAAFKLMRSKANVLDALVNEAMTEDELVHIIEDAAAQGARLELTQYTFAVLRAGVGRIANILERSRLLITLGTICNAHYSTILEDFDETKYSWSRECYEVASKYVLTLPRQDQLLCEEAIRRIPNRYPPKAIYLTQLACAMVDKKVWHSIPDELDRSLKLLNDVLPTRNFNLISLIDRLDCADLCLRALTAHETRFERDNKATDLDGALNYARLAQELIPGDPMFEFYSARILMRRFMLMGDSDDLERAMELTKERPKERSVNYLESRHPALMASYQKFRDISYLEAAIALMDEYLREMPDVVTPTLVCGHLMTLHTHFMDDRTQTDLLENTIQEAKIQMDTHKLDTTLAYRYNFLLGSSMRYRYYDISRDLADLEMAIEFLTKAVALSKEISLSFPDQLFFTGLIGNLADALTVRGEKHMRSSDVHQAMSICRDLVASRSRMVLSPYFLLLAVWQWYRCAQRPLLSKQERSDASMAAMSAAMEVFPQSAWLGTSLNTRQSALTTFWTPAIGKDRKYGFDDTTIAQIPSLAAAHAIACEEYVTAIEWLEQGRSVLWSQLLQLRAPLEEVRAVDPDLAMDMEKIKGELQKSSTQSRFGAHTFDQITGASGDGQQHRILTDAWENCLVKARAMPGLENFLLPRSFADLASADFDAPIVIINVSSVGCDALVVFPGSGDDILHIPLPDFSMNEANRLHTAMVSATRDDFAFRAPSRAGFLMDQDDGWDEDEIEFEDILSALWYEVAQPILESLAFSSMDDDEPSKRLYWCPTGQLAFLPLHAAGDYSLNEKGHKVHDYVVSSYTPTLGALIHPTLPPTSDDEEVRLLTVAVSSPNGQLPIHGTKDEVNRIEKRALAAQDRCHFEAIFEGSATSRRVLEGMQSSSWVHFACHGVQDTLSPAESALLLAGDAQLSISDVASVSLPRAQLAFLSACQTATGDKALPSESLHLAAGMLLAGYRSVIATLWSIQDRDAPQVADDVYGYLLRDTFIGKPQDRGAEAAVALHRAVAKLRSRVGQRAFRSWVPYIHVGV